MAHIKLEHVQKRFDNFVAVRDSSFTIEDGEFFVLLGPSGCGKTTTLRMIAGLELPSDGKIYLDGEDVTHKGANQRDIGFVFQLFALYPHMNVRQNIAFPLRCQGVPRAEIERRVDDVARLLQIEHLLARRVAGLSGGDSQRISLARAIVRQAKAFMMDEPLGALDSEFRQLMCAELRHLHDRIHATTAYVTHDQIEAMSMADRIAVMNHGIVDQIGSPGEVYDHPQSLHVAGFIGSPAMNFISFSSALAAGQSRLTLEGVELPIPLPRQSWPAQEFVLGVRPEHVTMTAEHGLKGSIFGSEYMGTMQIVTVTTPVGQIKARVPSSVSARPGEHVALQFRPGKTHLFERAGGRVIPAELGHPNAQTAALDAGVARV